MNIEDRFDELVASVGGFHRTWIAYLGIELGFFGALRTAGTGGMTAEELARWTSCPLVPVQNWVRAAHAADLIDLEGARATLDPELAAILLDEQRPEYFGGQVQLAVTASLDFGGLTEFFRSGRPLAARPERYSRAVERLTLQDVAVFFVEVLGRMPGLTALLSDGGRAVDVHCGGGRWLVAMARRFPDLELVGVEPDEGTAARARELVAAEGLSARVTIETCDIPAMGHAGECDLAYLQFALHDVADPVASLATAWRSVAPGGSLVVLDWCLPSRPEDDRTMLGELLWGTQIDRLYAGVPLFDRERFLDVFREAGLPEPAVDELPSGASLFVVKRAQA